MAKNPGIKQEEIAAQFGIERSAVSKILNSKVHLLSLPEDVILLPKFRCAPLVSLSLPSKRLPSTY